jgi:ribosomal protein S18 acetylase RimI-like enzyme
MIVTQAQITVRSADKQDKKLLANLIHFEMYVHRHLDWRPPLDWIGHDPYLVAERNGNLLATLVCPPDPPEIAWIHLFAVSSLWNVTDAWHALWPEALAQLRSTGKITVAAIPFQDWFEGRLDQAGFTQDHSITLLAWEKGSRSSAPRPTETRLRPMNFDDLPTVTEIDSASFGPLWRNSLESLQLAYRQSAVATVAEDETGLLGYQISTASPMGGHLARLAVLPRAQNKGIGFALVKDLLDQFERRGAVRVTVNTQQDNYASLALYEKAGFQQSGEVYPVYLYQAWELAD